MKKQRKFLFAIMSILVVTIALLAFTSSQVSNEHNAEQAELVIEKGAKADFNAAASYDGCGDGKCGDDKKEKAKKAKKEGDKCGEGKCGDDKKEKDGDKCGEGKCGEGKCGEGKETETTEEEKVEEEKTEE